ncbi:type II secretion system F family protein [Marivita geojedonensis]|uniref:Pilus assembly protein TadC n=1 Tax=Marivita geojedonensis TaxID=1123756 RepID=A0A1X4NMI3_9RHOB|nr:type II secretion system F family protein [Marivita geojedonensis]OSQ51639.1 pilus assembly protein TadC [Marivita geojedonensis]PRY79173.1 tight adherence protein C [Marivita geojedonensis]
MQAFNQFAVDLLGPAGPMILIAGLGVLLLILAIPMFFVSRSNPMDRLDANSGRKSLDEETRAVLRDKKKNEKLNKYAQFLEPQDAKELSDVRMKLLQAGYRTKDAVQLYYFAQFALGIGGLIIGVAYFMLIMDPSQATTQQTVLYTLGPGAAGYLFPKYWITKRVQTRQEEIESGFPDSLDMMLVCVEAGQSMDQAIVRVSKELRASYPSLADEFELVSYEMKAGKDKSAVLNDMGERCGVQDVMSFVTVLNQSQSFGTPISDALRVYAAEMRDKRVMRAEEKANKLPTKMTLTTMMLTVPPLLIILVGPSVVGIQQLGEIGGTMGQ